MINEQLYKNESLRSLREAVFECSLCCSPTWRSSMYQWKSTLACDTCKSNYVFQLLLFGGSTDCFIPVPEMPEIKTGSGSTVNYTYVDDDGFIQTLDVWGIVSETNP